MSKYRLAIYLKMQIGFLLKQEDDFIIIELPFISIMIATDKYASGKLIFGKHVN